MKIYFYGDAQNRPQGPVSLDDLRLLDGQGAIHANTPVIREGESAWSKWGEVLKVHEATSVTVPSREAVLAATIAEPTPAVTAPVEAAAASISDEILRTAEAAPSAAAPAAGALSSTMIAAAASFAMSGEGGERDVQLPETSPTSAPVSPTAPSASVEVKTLAGTQEVGQLSSAAPTGPDPTITNVGLAAPSRAPAPDDSIRVTSPPEGTTPAASTDIAAVTAGPPKLSGPKPPNLRSTSPAPALPAAARELPPKITEPAPVVEAAPVAPAPAAAKPAPVTTPPPARPTPESLAPASFHPVGFLLGIILVLIQVISLPMNLMAASALRLSDWGRRGALPALPPDWPVLTVLIFIVRPCAHILITLLLLGFTAYGAAVSEAEITPRVIAVVVGVIAAYFSNIVIGLWFDAAGLLLSMANSLKNVEKNAASGK